MNVAEFLQAWVCVRVCVQGAVTAANEGSGFKADRPGQKYDPAKCDPSW